MCRICPLNISCGSGEIVSGATANESERLIDKNDEFTKLNIDVQNLHIKCVAKATVSDTTCGMFDECVVFPLRVQLLRFEVVCPLCGATVLAMPSRLF